MPRPPLGRLRPAVIAAAALALPPPILHAALASAAGTAFEAAPFVLATLFLRSTRARRLAALGSCGCGTLPGALALPALALCWLAFGPALALTRFAGAVASLAIFGRNRAKHEPEPEPDPLADLETIALAAFAAALACAGLNAAAAAGRAGLLARDASLEAAILSNAIACAGGLIVGLLSPCATAAIATAAGLKSSAPLASAAILAVAGIVPPSAFRANGPRCTTVAHTNQAATTPRNDHRIAYALLACACLTLATHGASGFVHPRLLPVVGFGAAMCAVIAIRGSELARSRGSMFLPLALIGSLLAGSPVPRETIDATNLPDAFLGADVHFAGTAQTRDGTTTIVRYEITCCRADASPIALVTERKLDVRDGSWVQTDGTIARGERGLALHVRRWRLEPAPRDPFLYR
jgi:hypothetical protein